MIKFLLRILSGIVNSGVSPETPIHKAYKKRSINIFCLLCLIIPNYFYYFFLKNELYLGVIAFFVFQIGFASCIYLNHKRKFFVSKIILISTTVLSVTIVSVLLGYDSGFHLYLYTAPFFIFWVVDEFTFLSIIPTFSIYILALVFTFYHTEYHGSVYEIIHSGNEDVIYTINMICNMILMFFLFFNYSNYYKILLNSLTKKQTELETEIIKRTESESKTNKLYADLSVSYKNLEQFSFVVSHNIRAPLSNIKGFCGLFNLENPASKSNVELVQLISTSANDLDNVLRDLNEILNSKKHVLEKKNEVTFSSIVDKVEKLLSPEISYTKTFIERQFLESDVIYTIPTLMSSIMYNLLSNSIKYRKEDEMPHIKIGLIHNKKEEETQVFVADNGLGIDLEKYSDRLFTMYNRFHKSIQG
ncbi:MAG: ATP-binding protein, partial [Cytophagales bacterium]